MALDTCETLSHGSLKRGFEIDRMKDVELNRVKKNGHIPRMQRRLPKNSPPENVTRTR